MLIGISTKYQRELYWGIGNLVVYLEYFGFTLLFLLVVRGLFRVFNKEAFRRIAAAAFSLVLGFIVFVLMQDNRAVIEMKNGEYYPLKVVDEGVDRGMFSELEEGSILIIENLAYPPKGYFSYKAGKNVEIYSMEEFLEKSYPEGTVVFLCTCIADPYEQDLIMKKAVWRGGELVVDNISQLHLFRLETEK